MILGEVLIVMINPNQTVNNSSRGRFLLLLPRMACEQSTCDTPFPIPCPSVQQAVNNKKILKKSNQTTYIKVIYMVESKH